MPTRSRRKVAEAAKQRRLRKVEGSPEQAAYLNSTAGLAIETVKGLPKAAVKVAKAIVKAPVKVAKAIVKAPGKLVDKFVAKQKGVTDAKRNRNTQMIIDNFGSIENYKQLQESEMKIKKSKNRYNKTK